MIEVIFVYKLLIVFFGALRTSPPTKVVLMHISRVLFATSKKQKTRCTFVTL